MIRLSIGLFFVAILLSPRVHANDIPPFVFPELDRALIQVWLAADQKDQSSLEANYSLLVEQWGQNRAEIAEYPLASYNPYLLIGTLDGLLSHLDLARSLPDFEEAKAIVDAFQWEFQTVREFHYQDYYPLDLWWDINAIFTEISDATHDPRLGLLEWQELECLFDEMVCLLHDYEARAEEHLTQYAPQVDEDKHKAAMNQIYECVAEYQEALTFGYQQDLVWPCDQIAGALRDILRCYVPAATPNVVQ